jgi:DNA-binding MarR family transcriptional regulator
VQHAVLVELTTGPAHLRALARRLGLTRQAIHRASGSLLDQGLAAIAAQPDRRQIVLRLSDAGRAKLAELEPTISRIDRQLSSRIPRSDRPALDRCLDRLKAAVPIPTRELRWDG